MSIDRLTQKDLRLLDRRHDRRSLSSSRRKKIAVKVRTSLGRNPTGLLAENDERHQDSYVPRGK